MRIEINLNERLSTIQPKIIAYPEILIQARSAVLGIVSRGTFDFFSMTVAEFLQLQENKMPKVIIEILDKPGTTLKTYLKILNTFDQGAEAFQKVIEATTIKATPEETIAQSGLIDLSAEETMLNFLKEFFNLQNYEVAQGLTLYEYITARKVYYNTATFNKNYHNIKNPTT